MAPALVFTTAHGQEFQVNTDAGTAYQGYSACATAGDGSFFVTWEDGRNGGVDIFLQRFDATGLRQGTNVKVNAPTAPDQYAPSVACDAAGSGWIVWQDFRANGYPYNGDIYLQRVTAAGVLLGANTLVNDDGSEATQKEPAIAIGPAAALVVWSDLRAGQWEIYAQLFALDGTAEGANFAVANSRTSAQHAPSVVALADSTFVVAWYDARTGDEDIYAQRVRARATPPTPDIVVDRAGDSRTQRFPALSIGAAGGFSVVWEDFRGGSYPSGGRLYRRDFDATGAPIDTARAVSPGSHEQRRPRTSGDPAGNRIVVWEEEQNGVWTIFGRKFPSSDEAAEPAFQPGSDGATATRSRPQIALGAGKIFYTWTDLRRGNFDIFLEVETYRFPLFLLGPQAIALAVPVRAPELADTAVVRVTATGPVPVRVEWSGAPAWLSVTPQAATTPAEFTFRVIATPSADTAFTLIARDPAAPSEGQALAATVTLLEPLMQLTPRQVDLWIEAAPESTLVQVTNAVRGPLEWNHSDPGPPWLTRQAGEGALWIVFDPSGVPGDSIWIDTVWFSDPLAANSPLALPLSARSDYVPPAPPFLVASPPALFWSAQAGEATADSALLTLAANRDTVVTWSITGCPSWLYVDQGSGSTPSTLTVRAARDFQPLGTFTDTIEVWSPEASNSPLSVPVTMQVDIRSGVSGPEPEQQLGFRAYPNPFNSSILVEFRRLHGRPTAVRVIDRLGRTVDRLRVPGGDPGSPFSARWTPAAGTPSGLYFLSLEEGDGGPPIRVLYLK